MERLENERHQFGSSGGSAKQKTCKPGVGPKRMQSGRAERHNRPIFAGANWISDWFRQPDVSACRADWGEAARSRRIGHLWRNSDCL